MKVISVVSDIWCPSFIRQKQAFNINSKIYQKHGTVSPRKFGSSGPMIQKSCPRIGIPVPSRTKHATGHRCWMKNGVFVICHMELRFGLHRTGSRKFYSTLMKDLIDDYNAMIVSRPCHGSWILRVWAVNWWTSLQIPSRFIAGLSQRWSLEYRAENIGINSSKLQSGIILNAFIILAKTTFNRRFCLRYIVS